MQKLGLGRSLPVALAVILTVVVIAGLGMLIAAQVRDLSTDLPRYETTMIRKIQAVRSVSNSGGIQKLEQAIAKFASAFKPSQQNPGTTNSETAPGPGAVTATPQQPPLPVQVIQPELAPVEALMLVAAPLLHPLATAFIVLIFVIFVLLQRTDLRNRAIRLFGASDLQRTTAAINDGASRLSRYLLTLCAVNITAGTVIAVALWLIGVPSPVLLGILFGVLRFVPYVGPGHRGDLAPDPRGRGRPGLVDGPMDRCGAEYGRDDHRAGRRTLRLWPQHRSFADRDHPRGDILDRSVGASRPAAVDAADRVSRRARPPRREPRLPRRVAGGPAAFVALGNLLPAHARQRPR